MNFYSVFVCILKRFQYLIPFLSLIGKWKKTLDSKGYRCAMLMALSKAFGSINHELLIVKLYSCGFSKDALKMIHSYMSNLWQRTKLKSHLFLGLHL